MVYDFLIPLINIQSLVSEEIHSEKIPWVEYKDTSEYLIVDITMKIIRDSRVK